MEEEAVHVDGGGDDQKKVVVASCCCSLSLRADGVGQGDDPRVPSRRGSDRRIVVRTVEGREMMPMVQEQPRGTCSVEQSRRSVAGWGRRRHPAPDCFRVDCRCLVGNRAEEPGARGADGDAVRAEGEDGR